MTPDISGYISGNMDARRKAVKAHRKRLRARRMKRVEVTVHEADAPLVRKLAVELRRDEGTAQRLKKVLRNSVSAKNEPTAFEVIQNLPDISAPAFDKVFDEIERFRHDPIMMQVRDVDL